MEGSQQISTLKEICCLLDFPHKLFTQILVVESFRNFDKTQVHNKQIEENFLGTYMGAHKSYVYKILEQKIWEQNLIDSAFLRGGTVFHGCLETTLYIMTPTIDK